MPPAVSDNLGSAMRQIQVANDLRCSALELKDREFDLWIHRLESAATKTDAGIKHHRAHRAGRGHDGHRLPANRRVTWRCYGVSCRRPVTKQEVAKVVARLGDRAQVETGPWRMEGDEASKVFEVHFEGSAGAGARRASKLHGCLRDRSGRCEHVEIPTVPEGSQPLLHRGRREPEEGAAADCVQEGA